MNNILQILLDNSIQDTITIIDHNKEDITIEEVDDRIAEFNEDPTVREALSKGIHLRDYNLQIEKELESTHNSLVYDYLKQTDANLILYENIQEIDKLLQDMEVLLGGYRDDLKTMNHEISSIQDESKTLKLKLDNRKAAYKYSSELLDGIVISPDLIKKICEGEINEFFIQHLQELNSKMTYVVSNEDKQIKAFHDIGPELERLRIKAVDKIRDFLLKKIESLKIPNTNIALIQQNSLLKYKELFWFLMERYTPVGVEIHANYINVVNNYFLSSFERYVKSLQKLQLSSDKSELIGTVEGGRTGLFGGRQSLTNTVNMYSLGSRLDLLTTTDSGIIVPHHAEEQNQRFTYEAIFKSITRLLLDNACSEYQFTLEFFIDKNSKSPESVSQIFGEVFDPCLKYIQNVIRQHVDTTFDAIGLLMCIRINNQNIRMLQKRRLPCLDNFLNLINIVLWPKYQSIVGLHIDSLKKADPRKLITIKEPQPHYVVRRYAEFSASVLTLNQGYEDALLINSLSRLRTELESLMYRLAAEFNDKKISLTFWINNIDLIQTILNEHKSSSFEQEKKYFEQLMTLKMEEFVSLILTPHMGTMIDYVNKTEGQPKLINKDLIEKLALEFNNNWKVFISELNESIMGTFSNFQNGAKILHATLTQIILWFISLWEVYFKGTKSKVQPIGIQSLLVEVKKYKSTF
ncbi:Sac2 family-domain-containing protein [Globomyces pollinis-pini]|nr:Sac2 family-domain-containing protein [Globomyces pollinis-pini]